MSAARARRLAWGLAALVPTLLLGGWLVAVLGDAFELRISSVFVPAIAITFAIVGALVASRQPRNAIGWIFLGVAVSASAGTASRQLLESRIHSGDDPGAVFGAIAAYHEASWIPFVLIPATFLLLLFPDGRLPASRRWRVVAWCAAAGIALGLFTEATAPELSDFPTIDSPIAVDGALIDPLTALGLLLTLIAMVGSVSSLVVRFRRANHLQRQQIKWLAAAGAIVAVTFPSMLALYDVLPSGVADAGIMLTVLGLPAAAGIAILRHGLYDIDVVINRTLVYGALSATLAGAYIGGVLLLQLVLSAVTASSGLAVAATTLGVAALVRPARGRIQAVVDRRFYRRKYDAACTVEAFAGRLRDEVELAALQADLEAVVNETLQPAHVSLWLRSPPPPRGDRTTRREAPRAEGVRT